MHRIKHKAKRELKDCILSYAEELIFVVSDFVRTEIHCF